MLLRVIGVFAIILGMSLGVQAAKDDQHTDVGLWLARSCVGEAGFTSLETGECAAIMHIYKKRSSGSRKSIYKTARRYSAALKPVSNPQYRINNTWILSLRRNLQKPYNWNPRLRWNPHKILWRRMLIHADDFLKGRVTDPVPTAVHYGGNMDRGNLSPRYWRRITGLPYANTFYEARTKKVTNRWPKGYRAMANST